MEDVWFPIWVSFSTWINEMKIIFHLATANSFLPHMRPQQQLQLQVQQARQQQQQHNSNSNCTTATATQYDSECSKGYQRWQRVPFYYYFSFSFSFFSAFCPTVRVVEIDQRSIQPTIKPSNHLTDLQAGWENSENIAKNCSACSHFFFLPISIFFSRVLKLHKWLNMGKLSSHRRITS